MSVRGYGRERKWGAAPDQQRASMASGGVEAGGAHPPVYFDTLKPAKKSTVALPARGQAVNSLRPGDKLVIHDLPTLGTSAPDILAAMAAIGKKRATLVVMTPEVVEYTWHPDAAEIVKKATEAGALLKSEVHQRAAAKHLGAPSKWTPEVDKAAREGWKSTELTASQVPDYVFEQTGVRVSERLIWQRLAPLTKSQAEGTL